MGIWFLSITHPLRFHCKSHCNNSFRMIFCTLLSSSKSPTQDSNCGYSKEHFIFSPNAFWSFHKHPHKSILSLSGILFNVFFYSNQTLQLSTLSAPQGFIGQFLCGVVAKETLLQLLGNKSVIPPKSCTSSKYSPTICSCEIKSTARYNDIGIPFDLVFTISMDSLCLCR